MGHLYGTGVVCCDSLTWTPRPSMLLDLDGEIGCKGNILITVEKTLRVLDSADDPQVQTVLYAYNASVRGHYSFLRHDNAHPHRGHPDAHHRHEFNWQTEEDLPGSPSWVGGHGWPTLGDFIREVIAWYWAHRDQLPDPDAVPTLGLR